MRLPQDPPLYWRYAACCVLLIRSPRGPTTILIARRHCSAIAARLWHVAKNFATLHECKQKVRKSNELQKISKLFKRHYQKKILIIGRLSRQRSRHTKCVNIWKTVGDTSIVRGPTVNHSLNGSSSSALTATHNNPMAVCDFLSFFRLRPGGQTPNRSSCKMIQTTWIYARMCLLQQKSLLFITLDFQAHKNVKIWKIFGLRKYSFDLAFSIRSTDENTPQSEQAN